MFFGNEEVLWCVSIIIVNEWYIIKERLIGDIFLIKSYFLRLKNVKWYVCMKIVVLRVFCYLDIFYFDVIKLFVFIEKDLNKFEIFFCIIIVEEKVDIKGDFIGFIIFVEYILMFK